MTDVGVSIRDFGYPPDDLRHYGHPESESYQRHQHLFPAKARRSEAVAIKKPEVVYDRVSSAHVFTLASEAASESEHDETAEDDEDTSLSVARSFPFLLEHVQESLGEVRIAAAKGLFDFAKGADCEMEVKDGEHLLLVGPAKRPEDPQSTDPANPANNTNSLNIDRFASIESPTRSPMAVDLPAAYNTATHLCMEPEPAELMEHLEQFLQMQAEYGTGWVVGIKVCLRDVGGGPLSPANSTIALTNDKGESVRVVHRFHMRLVDIGLVPRSYVS
ncbi:hypothetical protein BC830DRAFT_724440 [Chytriomyces sp. MP71]|nr:hypothetical protein BC830DRAFT_724440 [Chytriomyces sp. MP71]